jgi:hypothetical protein
MSSPTPLCELFQVNSRFGRSVNIQADYTASNSLSGYIVTPLIRTILHRIGEGLQPKSRVRAWSITGPYGAGKSAGALFLARVLGHPIDLQARDLLRAVDSELFEELGENIAGLSNSGYVVVPVVGSREPFALALFRGLNSALRSSCVRNSEATAVEEWLTSRCEQIRQGEVACTALVSEGVTKVASVLGAASGKSLGLLIILDELGKLLEYAALNPERSDIFHLQALADLAGHSGSNPIGVMVVLHQAFERYAARLNPMQQREWAKVQGRFEDVGFLQSPAETLHLIGSAIQRKTNLDGLAGVIAHEASSADSLGLSPRELHSQEAERLLQSCAPLHPTVTVVLDRLFRSRLAQNERSLFAFLTSGEPHGFQDYLRRDSWTHDGYRPFYRVDMLYDYVHTAMGSALYVHAQGKRWAEIEDALDRLPREASPVDARVVKAIGLLGLLGDQQCVKASPDVLKCALADGKHVVEDDVEAAIVRLCQWGIGVYRRHKEAYSLWEGSDIDLDERFQKGLGQVDRRTSLATLLSKSWTPRPYLAKRHLHQTGTLRYFAPWIVDSDGLQEALSRPFGDADGAIVFVLPDGDGDEERPVATVLTASAKLPAPRKELVFFAVPRDLAGLRESLDEVAAWAWVAENTPELEGDSVARRELAGRRAEALDRVNRLCAHSFSKASSHESARWVWAGHEYEFRSGAELSSALSGACDVAYHGAPEVHNELVNRRSLSSAAAAARRNLIERMLSHSAEPRLGITGFPPELSMYRSVLEDSGLHHSTGSTWTFGAVSGEDHRRVWPLWEGIDAFLSSTEGEKRPVSDLFALLREPPYGIKNGLLPIYLAVAALSWDTELALYETGSFVPQPNIAVFERLMKAPEQFSIQRHRLGGARTYLFEKYSTLLGDTGASAGQSTLMTAVRPILSFVHHLPPYTLSTRRVSPTAIAVRQAVLAAREPAPLLFSALPQALGLPALDADADVAGGRAFFGALRVALLELQHAYDALLTEVQTEFTEAMRLPAEIKAARGEAARRAGALRERVADLRLRAFVLRLCDAALGDREWLESVASMIASKPPKSWSDEDLLRYGLELAQLAAVSRRVEEIVASDARTQGVQGQRSLRLAVTDAAGEEQREIVSVLPGEESDIAAVVAELQRAMGTAKVSQRVRVAAVAELARRVLQDESMAGGRQNARKG